MQKFVKLSMNSLSGESNRKDNTDDYKCKSDYWMSTKFDERVLFCRRLPDGGYLVELKQINAIECESGLKTQCRLT